MLQGSRLILEAKIPLDEGETGKENDELLCVTSFFHEEPEPSGKVFLTTKDLVTIPENLYKSFSVP